MNPVVLPLTNPNPSTKSTENTYNRIRDTRCTLYWPIRISPSMTAYWPRTILGMRALWSSELRASCISGNKLYNFQYCASQDVGSKNASRSRFWA